jgi:predicted Zn-dependent peptidase
VGGEKAVQAPGKDAAVAVLENWVLGVSQATLNNGLRVVMAPDPESPTVSICVTYDVGSRNEAVGQSGFAHLFEHMMFQGSRNVAKGQHFQLITARGGQLNGTTSSDRTNYFQTLPSSELELGLWLEADRMRWLDLSAENFENQRAVVKEEYRMRVENAAYRPALIELERQVFSGYFPYEHPTIGSMADLDAAKLEWVTQFHSKYYRPNNAVLTISGGFDPDTAMEIAQRYFGPIESGETAKFTEPTIPPLRTKENRSEITDVNAKTKALLIGWRIPPSRTPDHYALEMLARVLADGESSVLYDSLVRAKSLARDVSVYTYDHRGPDAFVTMVELNEGVDVAKVESIIDSTLETMMTRGPTPNVLSRARQRTKSAFIFGLQSNQARATTLGEYAVFYQNPRLIARDLENLLGVDAVTIREAAKRHLTKESRSVIVVVPKSTPAPLPASNPVTPAAGTVNARAKKESH